MASPSFAVECYRIDAKGNGTINGDGTTSARITGGGLLNGTTQGSFSAGSPFTGEIVLTTNSKQTVRFAADGTFTGNAFDATGVVTSGTGNYQNATGGKLTFQGQITSPSTFTETVTGALCL
jgi:hypothetical protein